MAAAVERTILTVHDATATLEAMKLVQQRTDELAYDVHGHVSAARKMYFRGTEGNAFLGALDVSRLPPAPGTRLPLPDEDDPIGPDEAGVPRTSNVLLFVREGDPFVCPANPAQRMVRYVDVYRFVCIYPHETTRKILVHQGGTARDLVVWTSVGFPSYTQLLSIQDATQRARVVKELHDVHGYAYAFDPNEPPERAFHALDGVGTISASPVVLDVIEESPDSPGGRLAYADYQLARTDPTSVVRNAVLTADDPADWVPDGFEVKVAGPSGNRQIWFRLTVESQSASARDVVHASTLRATIRDL
jgi:hypothetical protein